MQLGLGMKGDYAVRAVLELARHYGQRRSKSREIAEQMSIPERYLPQILAGLVRHGILAASAGPDGGYALTRPPRDISLFEVVEAAEGPLTGDKCMLRGGRCEWTNMCPLHLPWTRAQQAFVEELQSTTFAELSSLDAAITAGDPAMTETPGHRGQRARPVDNDEAAKLPSARGRARSSE